MHIQVILSGADAQAAAGGASDLDGLKAAAFYAAADVENNLAQRRTHGNLDKPGVIYVSGEGEGLGAVIVFRPHGLIPVRAL